MKTAGANNDSPHDDREVLNEMKCGSPKPECKRGCSVINHVDRSKMADEMAKSNSTKNGSIQPEGMAPTILGD